MSNFGARSREKGTDLFIAFHLQCTKQLPIKINEMSYKPDNPISRRVLRLNTDVIDYLLKSMAAADLIL